MAAAIHSISRLLTADVRASDADPLPTTSAVVIVDCIAGLMVVNCAWRVVLVECPDGDDMCGVMT